MKLRVLGYVRVSTSEQATSGVSLEAQAEKVRQFAALHDLDLVDIIQDPGVSAKSLDRPGLLSLLARLDSGDVSGLVVAKLDRLTRSISDLGQLLAGYFSEDRPSQLFSVADSIDTRTAAGRLVLNVVMSVAQWERETIVERTRDAMRHKRIKGEACGHAAYGSKLNPDDPRRSKGADRPVALAPCPAEREALALMRQLRGRGLSFKAIAGELSARGIPTKRGAGHWAPSTIHELLGRKEFEDSALNHLFAEDDGS